MNINIFKPFFDAVGLPYLGPYFTILLFSFLFAFPLNALIAPRLSLRTGRALLLTAVAIVASLFGSKLFHLLFDQQWPRYATILQEQGVVAFLAAAFNPFSAGHVFYGGFLAAFGVSYFVVRRIWREPPGRYGDIAAFPVALGIALARIGCFLAGCCFGRPSAAFGVSFPAYSPAAAELYMQGITDSYMEPTPPLIPTQLIESAICFFIFAYLVANLRHVARRAPWFFMKRFLLWYAVARFLIEFLRADLRGSFLLLSTSQWISLLILAALWLVGHRCRTCRTGLTGLPLMFLLVASPLMALSPDKDLNHFVTSRWGIPEGLPHAGIAAIAQTPDRFLWLATPAGLVRFDGNRFFTVPEGQLPGMADPRFTALAVSPDGTLWAGTEGGDIVRYRRDAGFTLFNRFRHGELPGTPIAALAAAGDTLYASTNDTVIRIRDGKIDLIKTPAAGVPLLAADDKGTVVALSGPDLLVFEGDRTERLTFSRLVGTSLTAVAFDTAGRLWAGTEQGAIIRFERLTDTNGLTVRTADGIAITAFAPDGDLMWAGTRGKGLLRIGVDASVTTSGDRHGLTGQSVRALRRDDDGALWVASEEGLLRFGDGPAMTLTTQDGLSNNLVYALAESPDGTLWIGTRGGGLNRYRDGQVTVYTTKNGLPSDLIGGLFLDDDGALWAGTSNGLAVLRPAGAITIYAERDGLSDPVIGAILRDRHRNLWVGTLNGDMHLFHARPGQKPFLAFRPDHAADNRQIHQIFEDRSGRMWVAAQSGLALFNNGFVKVWGQNEGLQHPAVLTVAEDRDLNIWAGLYRSGIALVRDDRVLPFTPRRGLPASDVFGILFDDENDRIWLATDNGILFLSRTDLLAHLEKDKPAPAVHRLGPQDGAKGTECTGGVQPVTLKGKDGKLYFSTLNGLVVVDPTAVRERAGTPQAYLAAVDHGAGPFLPTAELRLPADRRSLALEFGVRGFDRRTRPIYRYRLDGLHTEWRETSESHIRYDDLSPGAYHLTVQATYDRKNFGPSDELDIVIGKDRRPLATAIIVLLSLLATGGIFLAYRAYRRRAPAPSPPPPAPPATPSPAPISPPPSDAPRYEKSRLDDDTAKNLVAMLLDQMGKERLYKDPDLSLPALADKVGLSSHILSQLINDRLGKNFNAFINEYRVNEVRRMLEDPANRDKLLAIAYDAGFRSKSTFNAIFKKCTGKTPSEYRKSLDGGEVPDHGEMPD